MTGSGRVRRLFSVRAELLSKSREAALAAVQVFNSPAITFKAETFVVLMVVAWTYLLHAYYRSQKIDYRYCSQGQRRRRYDRTKHGAYKHWELERCLNDKACPLEPDVANNLRFLVGLRHEIEHQMTTRIDDLVSARFQACCINFDEVIVSLFGRTHGIARHLAVSLQFAALQDEQVEALDQHPGLPGHIRRYIEGFDGALTETQYASPKYAYRVVFVPKTVNHTNQADRVITFLKADSKDAQTVGVAYAVIKETEKRKWLPSQVVKKMKDEGHTWFGMHQHTELWQGRSAKDPATGFGVTVAKTWYWYDTWVAEVRKYCVEQEAA